MCVAWGIIYISFCVVPVAFSIASSVMYLESLLSPVIINKGWSRSAMRSVASHFIKSSRLLTGADAPSLSWRYFDILNAVGWDVLAPWHSSALPLIGRVASDGHVAGLGQLLGEETAHLFLHSTVGMAHNHGCIAAVMGVAFRV